MIEDWTDIVDWEKDWPSTAMPGYGHPHRKREDIKAPTFIGEKAAWKTGKLQSVKSYTTFIKGTHMRIFSCLSDGEDFLNKDTKHQSKMMINLILKMGNH